MSWRLSTTRSIAVVGSRTYPADADFYDSLPEDKQADLQIKGYQYVREFMDKLEGGKRLTIVSGGAPGVDTWAAEIAAEKGFSNVTICPNYKKFGKGATFRRNTEIVMAADDVVAFWDQVSTGTYDTIKKAIEFKKDLMVFGNDGQLFMAFTQEDYERERPKLIIPRG